MGGHSGSDIHLQRANAQQLRGRLLTRLLAETDFWVAQIHGGNMDNAIARSCRLVGCVALDQAEKAQQLGEAWLAEMRQEYGQTEPDMTLTIQETVEGEQVFDKPSFGSLALAEYVRAGGYKSVEFIGVCTDICVISNALLVGAYCPETEICVRADCCAGTTPEAHAAALCSMRSCQAEVV